MKLMAYDSPDSDAVHQVDALYLDGSFVGNPVGKILFTDVDHDPAQIGLTRAMLLRLVNGLCGSWTFFGSPALLRDSRPIYKTCRVERRFAGPLRLPRHQAMSQQSPHHLFARHDIYRIFQIIYGLFFRDLITKSY